MAGTTMSHPEPARQDPLEGLTRIPFDDLVDLLRALFLKHGTSAAVADTLAVNCASAQRDGAESHGVFRMPGYLSTLRSGWVDGHAVPVVEDATSAFIRVDARNGFAQPALAAAANLAMDKARKTGIIAVTIRDSHHFSALWLDVEPFARQGFVALTMVNGISRVTPHGGVRPVYGTNPMAFAAPRSDGPPLVFDQASSAMAFGDLRLAALNGQTVPPGTGVDREGRPTTDPNAILDGGALLPFGQHKGSSIAMMIEVLAAALTGAQFSFEVDRSQYPGAETSRSGQLLLLIDPSVSAGRSCADRVSDLVGQLRGSGQSRLPGDHRYARRERAQAEGVSINQKALADLKARLRNQ